MSFIPKNMRTEEGMEAAMRQVSTLIKKTNEHEQLLEIMTSFRAISVNADGISYDFLLTHDNTLKYLVDILDLPIKNNPTQKEKDLRISL